MILVIPDILYDMSLSRRNRNLYRRPEVRAVWRVDRGARREQGRFRDGVQHRAFDYAEYFRRRCEVRPLPTPLVNITMNLRPPSCGERSVHAPNTIKHAYQQLHAGFKSAAKELVARLCSLGYSDATVSF